MTMAPVPIAAHRTIVYIDGFNLYFGLRAAGLDKYRWLDLQSLALKVAQARQLIKTKYFTARISGPDQDKQKRQTTYLEALETLSDVEIVYGKYLRNEKQCYNCQRLIGSYSEKMTDVNIAVALLSDAYTDQFDTAILVSGDSDLCPAVETIRRLFPAKHLIVGFPPKRVSQELRRVATSYFAVSESAIKRSLLPPTVYKSDGTPLQCPARWT